MSHLYIIRGPSGSGKTTLAEAMHRKGLVQAHYEADRYRIGHDGIYRYDPAKNNECHELCLTDTREALEAGLDVAVSNVFRTVAHMQPYFDLGYPFTVIRCEGKFQDVHGVAEADLQHTRDNFEDYPPKEAKASADAKAAVAVAIEKARALVRGRGAKGQMIYGDATIEAIDAAISAIAPDDAIAEVAEWKRLAIAGNLIALEMRNVEAERDRLAAELAAANARVAELEAALSGGVLTKDDSLQVLQRLSIAEADLAAANARVEGLRGAVKALCAVLDRNDKKGPIPDVEMMFCWLAAQGVRAAEKAADAALAQPTGDGK